MKKRLFIASKPPEFLTEEIKRFEKENQNFLKIKNFRFTNRNNLHITILFLGYIEEEKIPQIELVLSNFFSKQKPFNLEFERFSFAPPSLGEAGPLESAKRMVWAVFKESREYEELVEKTAEVLKDFGDFKEERKIIPHITIARFNPSQIKNISIIKSPKIKPFTIQNTNLYESKLSRLGPVYREIKNFLFV